MRTGFTFRGRHSSELGLIFKSGKRPLLPPPKLNVEDLPGRDGTYDFSAVNEDGRIHYGDRMIELSVKVYGPTIAEMQERQTAYSRWLFDCTNHYGYLCFDDMPTTFWLARLENCEQAGYELGRLGAATLLFRAHPFALYRFQWEQLLLDSEISLDTDALLGFDTGRDVSGTMAVAVENLGDHVSRPTITATGVFQTLSFSLGGRTLAYDGGCAVGQTLVLDFARQLATLDGADKIAATTGGFFDFPLGTNQLQIAMDGAAHLEFFLPYYFIYGAVIQGD